MKVIYLFSIMAILLFVQSCSSLKGLNQFGSKQEVVHNAILDFSNTSKLYKKSTAFSVYYQDTLYRMALEEHGDGVSRWVPYNKFVDIVAVSISANNNKLLLTSDSKIGSEGKLPSRFIERDGKLFFWWDDNYPLTEEAFTILKKYDLLQDDEGGMITVPDFIIDDSKKSAHYYFCRDNLTKYKKVITNKGMGYYDPPKLDCE